MLGNSSCNVSANPVVHQSLQRLAFGVFSAQILIGSIANFVVIATIFVSRELRQRSEHRLMLNLAIVDLLSLATVLPWHIYILHLQQIDRDANSFIGYRASKSFLIFVAINTFLCLAIDRFVAVVYPFHHPEIINTRSMTVFSWGSGLPLTIIVFLSSEFALQKYIDVFVVLYGVLCLTLTAFMYAIIFYCTLKQGRRILNQRRSVSASRAKFSSHLLMKITLRTFILVCLFYATYLPVVASVAYSMFVLEPGCRVEPSKERIWFYSFLFINSFVNPFVYALRSKGFRKEFQKKIWSRVSHRTTQETSGHHLSH